VGFAAFVGWRLSPTVRRSQYDVEVAEGLYQGWLAVLRFLAGARHRPDLPVWDWRGVGHADRSGSPARLTGVLTT